MSNNRRIDFRVSRNDYERIINNAQAKGYATVSAYLRSIALEKDLFLESKVIETNNNVKKILQLLEK